MKKSRMAAEDKVTSDPNVAGDWMAPGTTPATTSATSAAAHVNHSGVLQIPHLKTSHVNGV